MATTLRPGEVTVIRPGSRLRAIGFVIAATALAVAAALLVPDYLVEPMGRETHYMALVGPGNPHGPWTLLWLMAAPVLVVYGLILPTLPGWLPSSAAKGGAVLLGLVTATIAGYLVRWAIIPLSLEGDWHGLVDAVAMVALAATAIPAVAAGAVVVARGELDVAKVVLAGIVLHVGMIGGMLAADLLGGRAGAPHVG
jgi:hypothetical protein